MLQFLGTVTQCSQSPSFNYFFFKNQRKAPGFLTLHDKESEATRAPAADGLHTAAVPLKGDCTRANASKSSC